MIKDDQNGGEGWEKVQGRFGDSAKKILVLIDQDSEVTISHLAEEIGISNRAIQKNIKNLKKEGILKRVGERKEGYWKIIFE